MAYNLDATHTTASVELEAGSNTIGKIDINGMNVALENSIVNINATASALPVSNLANRKTMLVKNEGAVKAYLGKSDVTADATAATGGVQLAAGASLPLDVGPTPVLYGITASGTTNISCLEAS